ncbi:DHH family phosphoesterase [Parasporobacterium paucivorans]|uniref:Cyclic-di-AMP phosphodiesterase n=1 Tax=Parasporobacterium paucivorans DSM 15970 TaxID=1122934 RepID=A0A1M6J2M5_9FIRM|nr:DHH family phosphoesterase [Parasporobacterium paucivorans]SHJ40902.1 c-di-AMP phosphodiesterase, consists of a GGDEF-like and DHH domains [Parasporobacterium paucivorans DSM 15970]
MKNRWNKGFTPYMYWPLILSGLLVIVNIVIYMIDARAGVTLLVFTLVFISISLVLLIGSRPKITNEIITMTEGLAKSQSRMLMELPVPYCVLNKDGRILWMNKRFTDLIGTGKAADKKITSLFPEITEEELRFGEEDSVGEIAFKGRNYRVEFKKITWKESEDDDILTDIPSEQDDMFSVGLFDETEMLNLRKENTEQKFVAALVYLDNFEEVMETVEAVRKSLILALIDRKINKYFTAMDGVVRKLEKDKYFIVLKQKYISVLQSNKFNILDEVKSINIGNEMPVTISIGLGVNGETYSKTCEFSRTAIDLALGRGGDQAVIKDGEKIYYYGGKSKQVEKNTRVKARVKAHALRELLNSKEDVLIMGHKLGDIDSVGASVGIYRVARTLDRKAHIVIGEMTNSVKPIIDGFKAGDEYEEDMFISGSQALQILNDNTVLVLVDVNKPSFVEEPRLVSGSKATVILDHHRQGSEVVENAVLSYIEPFASSTCEMVSEILQYISEDIRLKQAEADALYAGIMIDTNYFANSTGARTFEAAAFLKRNGADINKVRKMFWDDFDAFKARAVTYHNAEIFREFFIIGECPSEHIESPTVTAAQAANEMLEIRGIKASFVVTRYNNTIYISARSVDEINVQLVMERLGGGGHLNVAGAQLKEVTLDEAKQIVKDTLSKMIEEGDI